MLLFQLHTPLYIHKISTNQLYLLQTIGFMKIVDLSKNIEYRKSDPWFMKIKIKHKAHKQSK